MSNHTSDLALSPKDAIAIREEHLPHERNLRAAGVVLYLYGGLFTATGGIGGLFHAADLAGFGPLGVAEKPPLALSTTLLMVCCLAGILGTWFLFGGAWIRRLERRGVWPAAVAVLLLLFAFPIGTLFAILVAVILLKGETKRVLSPEYREAVQLTPQISCKLSIVTKVAFGCLALVGVLAMIGLALVALGLIEPAR